MNTNNNTSNGGTSKGAAATGIIAAIAASSCCISPVVGVIAGVGGAAGSLSWMEPFRPYLIGLAVIAIGYAWYNYLKPKNEDDCGCDIEKPKFYQTKGFLIGMTIFAIVSVNFPYYSSIFYPKIKSNIVVVKSDNVQEASFSIEGMTCTGCEEHIKNALAELPGYIDANVSYEKKFASIKFDKSKSTLDEVVAAINTTGYAVTNQK